MDALSALITLLQPHAVGAKLIHGAGRWGVRYERFGHPSYALVLKGPCWLAAEGMAPRTLDTGDFLLFPSTPGFTLASGPNVRPKPAEPVASGGQMEEVFHGDPTTTPSATLLGGYFLFEPVNASLLMGLLPKMLHLRSKQASCADLAPLVELIKKEALAKRVGQSFMLRRLVEIMLVESLRSAPPDLAPTGLLAGLRDSRLAPALHAIHTQTAQPWTLATLAREASMSRSSFAAHFAHIIGTTPMHYLLQWRLTTAKNLLRSGSMGVAETALAVGYESASGFSIAFSREIGRPPKAFMAKPQRTQNEALTGMALV